MKTSTMKNVIMGSVLAVAAATSLSANAAAQTVCSGGVAANGNQVVSGTNFVKVAFTPKCSANVMLQGNDLSATVYLVSSASVKGKTTFNGSSVGGAVTKYGECSASPCTPTEVGTALTNAPST